MRETDMHDNIEYYSVRRTWALVIGGGAVLWAVLLTAGWLVVRAVA